MSYYLLPSKNTSVEFLHIINESFTLEPFISPSFDYYKSLLQEQVKKIVQEDSGGYAIEFLQKITHSYDYIFSKVPGTKFSVAKMKPHSDSFYIFLEMINVIDLFDYFQHRKITSLFHGPNAKAMSDCTDILRENFSDIQVEINDLINCKDITHNIDFLYFELEETFYNDKKICIRELLNFLSIILQFQSDKGVCVLKITSLMDKSILDIIYVLTSLYEKVYIIKPSVSNLSNSEKFIVCKKFKFSLDLVQYYLHEIHSILYNVPYDALITSILKTSLPYYFLNKIEEVNIIIGHQQLESMEQIINLVRSKNREEKIESLKKANIQKCIQWCEKYRIPCNKFTEKVNIFLSSSPPESEHLLECTKPEENTILYLENEELHVYR
jgi:23S rRNA U2552 (ribose-2'-O)-methylase RlmE/FtsJ